MQTSPLLDRHLVAGARAGARPEAPAIDTVLTFGDVPAEYRAAREHCALFDASDRGRITVRGGEAAPFLQRILANDVVGLGDHEGNRNLLLTPKGKVSVLFDLARLGAELALSTPPGAEEATRTGLDVFLFGEDVQLEASGATHAPLELAGPASRAVAAHALGFDERELAELPEHRTLVGAAGTVVPLTVSGLPGLRVDVGPERVAEAWDALAAAGAVPAGLVARDSLRVETGAALFGADVDENVYPQEAGLDDAFSLSKGCYVGQEVVAKIDTYGGLNKRLLALEVEHSDPVPRGTRVLESGDERELGLVTSWAFSFALDTGLVLAYVKRKHQEPGTRFRLSEGHGEAVVVPFPG